MRLSFIKNSNSLKIERERTSKASISANQAFHIPPIQRASTKQSLGSNNQNGLEFEEKDSSLIPESKMSFISDAKSNVHEHAHRKTPHLHVSGICDRFTSGVDRNRANRFYFTKQITPCRVYLSYNERLLTSPVDTNLGNLKDATQFNQQKDLIYNGRKFSPRTLKCHFRINPKYIEGN